MEVLTRNRADAELNQAGEREGARVAEKASNSHRLPSGPRQTAVCQGGDLVSSGNSFPPRQPGDAAEPHVLRSGSWGLEQEMRTPLGPQQVGVGGACAPGSLHQCQGSMLTPTKCGKDTSYPSYSGLFRLVAGAVLGVHGLGVR